MNILFAPPAFPDAPTEREGLRARLTAEFGACTVWRTPGAPDILMFPPQPGRDHYLLITCGVSACEMTPPCDVPRCAEFALTLDAAWPVADLHDPQAVWPLHLLAQVGRFVARAGWVATGHLIDLDGPLPGTSYRHVVVSPTVDLPLDGVTLGGRQVALYSLIPAFSSEVQFVRGRPLGGLTLINRLLSAGVSERVTRTRPQVVTPAEECARLLN